MHDRSALWLESSSDAILILRLEDAVIVEVNQPASDLTGRSRSKLLGRSSRNLAIWLGPASPTSTFLGPLARGETVGDLPVAVRTGPGGLRITRLSGLRLDIEGQGHALCVMRDSRAPTPLERRLAAHTELGRMLDEQRPWPKVAPEVLAALGECLGWDAAALWEVDPQAERLHCAAFWHAPSCDVKALQVATQRSRFRPGVGLLGRVWLTARPAWTSNIDPDTDCARGRAAAREGIRGWFAWPVLATDKVVGMVELFSCEPRPADGDLLELATGLGQHLGQVMRHRGVDSQASASPLVATLVQEQEPQPMADDPPALLRELAAGVGRLNRLLENVTELNHPQEEPVAAGPLEAAKASADLQPEHPVSMTLKAVSKRTGIPAATVRTWERRYGFIQPARSASGYRLYREGDIARILMVKHLLEQGVRISQAAMAVSGEAS
jgi:PAS domain-containing protein